jgi:hypothetical protein
VGQTDIGAGVTPLLGIVGLYGVIAFILSPRTRERVALGSGARTSG